MGNTSAGIVLALLSQVVSTAAVAQTYPSKALRIIIPFAPGGPTDIMGRIAAERLNRTLGVPVIADNRPGAGGNIGGRQCAKSPPDGYTLCMITPSAPIAVSMVKDLGFDPVTDFAHITLIANLPSLLTAHPSLPVRTVNDLIAFAKARPDQLVFSSAGNGTSPHMMMELFKTMTGVRMTHVPYKGLAMAVMDQVSGQIPVAFNTAISVVPHIQTGRLRGIATSSRERFPLLPDLPSVDESGVKGFDGGAWQGIVLPAKTPREIVMKLYGELQPMLASAETKEKFLAQGAMPSGMKPEEFAAFMKGETEKWARVAKAAGIRPE
jgi:tripartite-type tricarboxylate transporter receptor subunit TctC